MFRKISISKAIKASYYFILFFRLQIIENVEFEENACKRGMDELLWIFWSQTFQDLKLTMEFSGLCPQSPPIKHTASQIEDYIHPPAYTLVGVNSTIENFGAASVL